MRAPRIFLWSISVAWLTFLTVAAASQVHELTDRVLPLLPWIVLLAAANLLPVPGWQASHLAVDLPIEVAAGLVLSPIETALVCFFGAFDVREFRSQLTLDKAVFNRCQVSGSCLVGSFVAHLLEESPASSPLILPIAFAALISLFAVNYLLVSTAISLEHGYPIRRVISRLRLGTIEDFGVSFLAWGVLGAMLAALYDRIQPWALLAFLGPTLLSRQALLRSQSYLEAAEAYHSRDAVLAHLSHQIYEERSDERRLIAADLHDEVLQPLYKVQLMAHVLKADLSSGRILDIDEDMPHLLTAAELASGTLRDLIGDLRRSTVGSGGLHGALMSLIKGFERQSTMSIHSELQEVSAGPEVDLALYQIAKEALTNATSHSRGENLWVELTQEIDAVRLVIRDDGVGFDPLGIREGHYGMLIMHERAQTLGGDLFVDSSPGRGAQITLSIKTHQQRTGDTANP